LLNLNCWISYVERTRAYYLQREGWEPGVEVDDEYVWVGWQDGHGPGLKALVNEEQMKRVVSD